MKRQPAATHHLLSFNSTAQAQASASVEAEASEEASVEAEASASAEASVEASEEAKAEAGEGSRYCRGCNATLPLSLFMPGKRRFRCRTCYYTLQRAGVGNSKSRILYDARRTAEKHFAGCDEGFNLDAVRAIIIMAATPKSSSILPLNPQRALSSTNCLVCTALQRKILVALWTQGGKEPTQYMQVAKTFVSATHPPSHIHDQLE